MKVTDSLIADNTGYSAGGVNVYENSQVEIFNSTISGNTSGFDSEGISSSDDSTVTLINSNVNNNSIDEDIIQLVTLRIEAEDLIETTYRLEDNAIASGGQLLSLRGGEENEVGIASFDFTGVTGNYIVKIDTYDENDGTASITLELNGSQIGQTIVLDDDLGRNLGDSYTAVSKNIAFGISLEAGDVLTVNGFEEGGEFARLDYLEFIATESF